MANRVTASEVLEIIDTSLEESEVEVFIDTAHMLVEGYLGSSSLTENTLTEIEKYMSAHVLSVKDQRVKSEKVDVISTTYTGTFGKGLNMTQYGQMAILLDTSGTLGKIAEGGANSVSFGVVGYH